MFCVTFKTYRRKIIVVSVYYTTNKNLDFLAKHAEKYSGILRNAFITSVVYSNQDWRVCSECYIIVVYM